MDNFVELMDYLTIKVRGSGTKSGLPPFCRPRPKSDEGKERKGGSYKNISVSVATGAPQQIKTVKDGSHPTACNGASCRVAGAFRGTFPVGPSGPCCRLPTSHFHTGPRTGETDDDCSRSCPHIQPVGSDDDRCCR